MYAFSQASCFFRKHLAGQWLNKYQWTALSGKLELNHEYEKYTGEEQHQTPHAERIENKGTRKRLLEDVWEGGYKLLQFVGIGGAEGEGDAVAVIMNKETGVCETTNACNIKFDLTP